VITRVVRGRTVKTAVPRTTLSFCPVCGLQGRFYGPAMGVSR
jgi:hypothetical protein